jgi:integrase
MGLGSLNDISLAEARGVAKEARKKVQAGTNPVDEKRRQRLSQGLQTFGELADQLIKDLEPSWKSPIHARQWRTTLTVDAAPLRSLPLHAISTDDVLGVLKPIWHSKPETASRLRGRIERVLDAAKARGLRHGENPARWKGHLSAILSAPTRLSRGHHAALPYTDIAAFMTLLRGSDCVSASALELTILCALRSGEVRAAHRGEFDLDAGLWTIPGERMKRKIPHRVPLTARALEIVKARIEVAGKDGFLFPGQRRQGGKVMVISNMAMPNLLPHLGFPDITVHGFRSTFRDWVGDCTTYNRELAEAALHHVAGDAVEQAYRRSDAFHPRKPLMDAWARYCAGESASVVVSMSGGNQDNAEARRA